MTAKMSWSYYISLNIDTLRINANNVISRIKPQSGGSYNLWKGKRDFQVQGLQNVFYFIYSIMTFKLLTLWEIFEHTSFAQ